MVIQCNVSPPTATSTLISENILLVNRQQRPRRQRCSSPAGCVLKNKENEHFDLDEEFMDDEGDYSTSSSYGSVTSSPDLSNKYPRGIINPNYPGFQHLAHTLSEHFVNHTNDIDDSDLSEFEIELNIDNRDKLEKLNNIVNNNNNNNIVTNTFNRNLRKTINLNNNIINSDAMSNDELNYNLETSMRSIKETREHKEILLPEIRVSFECHDLKNDKRFDKIANTKKIDCDSIEDNLRSIDQHPRKLTKKICSDDIESKYEQISSMYDLETYLQKYDNKQMNSSILTDGELETNRNCPTPDILQKNNNNDFSHRCGSSPLSSTYLFANKVCNSGLDATKSSTNPPDLLKNVAPIQSNRQTNKMDESMNSDTDSNGDDEDDDNDTDDDINNNDENLDSENDDSQLTSHEKGSDADSFDEKILKNDKINRAQVPNHIPIEVTQTNDAKDDNSFGITPVDIVGDFGREVEKEFGLLVTGYNTRLCRDPSPVFDEIEQKFLEKVVDAKLSDGKEQITPSVLSKSSMSVSSVSASIVLARASLNQPVASQTVGGDLNQLNEAAIKKSKSKNSIQPKQTVNCISNHVNDHKTFIKFEKQVKQRVPPPPPPRKFLAQQLLQQKQQQDLKLQTQNALISNIITTSSNSTAPQPQKSDCATVATKNIQNTNLIVDINSSNNHQPTADRTVNVVAHSKIAEFVEPVVAAVESELTKTKNSASITTRKEDKQQLIIVSPKYKKYSSYDDRELPTIINLVNYCNTDNSSSSSSSNSDDHSVSSVNNRSANKIKSRKQKINNICQTSVDESCKQQLRNIQTVHDSTKQQQIDCASNLTKKLSSKNCGNNYQHYHKQSGFSGQVCHQQNDEMSAKEKNNNNILAESKSLQHKIHSQNADGFIKIESKNSEYNNNNLYGNCRDGKLLRKNHSYKNINNSFVSDRVGGVRKMKSKPEKSSSSGNFDVYNIETALPVIDLDVIESHLKKAKEEEKKRRNDREEIRRRLAMGAEDNDYFSKIGNSDRPGRKPSLQSRLQNGMNLQICFMNDASSDTESPSSDSETCPKLSKTKNMTSTSSLSTASSRYSLKSTNSIKSFDNNVNNKSNIMQNKRLMSQRPSTLSLISSVSSNDEESDFFTKQARLQIEARMALAQAKDMAHMQMEIERQKQKQSPITEIIRNSLEKIGVPFPPEKRRLSRQICTDMNIAQLQIIVNELHSQIERLNEKLVKYLMERDELHMGQDSMLVDIEDLTRYLGAKEQTLLNEKMNNGFTATVTDTPPMQCKINRITNLVKK